MIHAPENYKLERHSTPDRTFLFARNKHLFDDGPEDASVAFVIDAVGERKVDGVVLSLAHTWTHKRSRI